MEFVPIQQTCSISITCTISNVFEITINNYYLKHLVNGSLLSEYRYGFRINMWSSLICHIWQINCFVHVWNSLPNEIVNSAKFTILNQNGISYSEFIILIFCLWFFFPISWMWLPLDLRTYIYWLSIGALSQLVIMIITKIMYLFVLCIGSVSPPQTINSGNPQGYV